MGEPIPREGELGEGMGAAGAREGRDGLREGGDGIRECADLYPKGTIARRWGNPTPWPDLQIRLNRLLSGWAESFSFGFTGQADDAIEWHVRERARRFLCRRHKLRVSGTGRFGVRRDPREDGSGRHPPGAPVTKARACSLVKPVREPDAGDPQVRFDERRWENGATAETEAPAPRRKPPATATPSA